MDEGEQQTADAQAQAHARALSSPLRLRVLRLCGYDARTNKELAELLQVNPGTMLHHVRTLVQTGYLVPEPARAGKQGAREVPYRATGASWQAQPPGLSRVLIDTMLQQLAGVDADEIHISWLGLRLNAQHRAELEDRLYALIDEFRLRGPDEDGDALSLVTVLHPDLNPPAQVRGTSDGSPVGA